MSTCRAFLCRLFSGVSLFCLADGAVSSAHADILALDWAHLSAAYQSGAANATTTQNFTVGSNTVGTVFGSTTSQFAFSTPTVATYGTTAPNTTTFTNGGISNTDLALQIGVDLSNINTQEVTFTINFSQAVYGATFRLFDVDANPVTAGFVDQIRNVIANGNPSTNLPTLTGSADNVVGSAANNMTAGLTNSVTGVSAAANNTGDANILVTFANNVPVTQISFTYGDNRSSALGFVTQADSAQEIIGLSNIYWSTVSGQSVPEPGTLSMVGMGLTGLAAVVMRRRRD